MSNPLRLCLDLNIWCTALLADIKENQNYIELYVKL
jgi:hypothetical protein